MPILPELFILFAGFDYYASGGMRDVVATFPSIDQAKAYGDQLLAREITDEPFTHQAPDWIHIARAWNDRFEFALAHGAYLVPDAQGYGKSCHGWHYPRV